MKKLKIEIDDINTMTKVVQDIYDKHGVSVDYTIKRSEADIELTVGTENWNYELAIYKGNNLRECINLFQLEVNSDESSNSSLRRYLEKLPIFSELKDLFSSNSILFDTNSKSKFPNNLMELSLKEHADVISRVYEPNLLTEFLFRLANELSDVKKRGTS